jgi:acyl transferase domain-containing protein/NADPH:quinone reductase-like Zn-dependent oxidoreductase/NAD(P)-dependent dehydrogenase (short-subunit alcohol dehydrogenase family)/acyl carrier protein
MNQRVEPIAIIGMGCRFPGDASNPREFWKMLCEGKDAICNIPKDRWDVKRYYSSDQNTLGKMYVKEGGFLSENWAEFDAEFFRISPREANFLDPQQRLLLELTWEALEDGGIVPKKLENTDTGVFIGAFTTDWQSLNNKPFNMNHCGMYSGINSSMTILSARLAHFFDLKGPCLTVDTACSSSLVAVHLACQNLWEKSCEVAIAGGVNAMLIPETTIAMSKGRFLNPEGRCRAFDAKAMGYVRGEGGGVVILKPLKDALRDNDPIYALIRGTGVNHDGYTQGIALPNPESQKNLIKKVLNDTGINPADIYYVEAHGTGTPVGDPIEAMALNDVLQVASRKHPCFLGAVKSNIGHLEAAAGIAGFIKAVLCLKHKKIPPNLHFNTPNPNIPFEKYCLKIPTEIASFPTTGKSLYAGVNAFGYGGTNAHAILESYESKKIESENLFAEPQIFPFSALNLDALKNIAINFAQFIEKKPENNLRDIQFTLSNKRTLFPHRLAVSAQTKEELKLKLHQFSQGIQVEGCVQGKMLEGKPKLAFIYTGMGPQWWGMGKELLKSSLQFQAVVKICDEALIPLAGWSILEELQKNEQNSLMDNPVIAQVSNYVIQVGITQMMKSWGVEPELIVGHSIGEVAAAYVSGALTLEEGLLVAYYRSSIQASQINKGTMLAVGISEDEAIEILAPFKNKISIAAINGPQSLTLAGTREDLEMIIAILDQKNIFNRFLKVNIAYHSHQMDALENQVLDTLKFLKPKRSKLEQLSTVTGKALNDTPMDAKYWWRNIRQPVLFGDAIQETIEGGCNLFVEIGPHPVLRSFVKENLRLMQIEGECLSSLNRKKTEMTSLLDCLCALFVSGYTFKALGGKYIPLPTYPWQKKAYWIESEESVQYRLSASGHTMLSRRVKSPNLTWQVEVNQNFFPWLDDHKIDGTIVFPGAGYVEAALAIHANFPCVIEDISFEKMLIIESPKESILQISLDPISKVFKVHSLVEGDGWDCTTHASGKISAYIPKQSSNLVDLEKLKVHGFIEGQVIYKQFRQQGLDYGSSFCLIKKLWKGNHEALSEIDISGHLEGYHLHPTLLDAAFQTLIGTIDSKKTDGLIIPSRLESVTFFSTPKKIAYCHARCVSITPNKIIGDLILCDNSGIICAEIKGLECRMLTKATPFNETNLLYQIEWEETSLKERAENEPEKVWLVGFSPQLAENLKGHPFTTTHLETYEAAEQLLKSYTEVKDLHVLLAYEANALNHSTAQEEIQAVNGCVNLIKAIENVRREKLSTLWIVTQGGLKGSSLWGLCRVIRQEYPHVCVRLLDLDPNQPMDSSIIGGEAKHMTHEDEVKWVNGKRYTSKLKKNTTMDAHRELSNYSLELKTAGLIDSLYFKEINTREPLPHEVAIQVHSTSLNFKDLMKVLGMLDQNVLEGTYFGSSFGMECSGTITKVGNKVKKYALGDKVCAFMPNTFQSYICVSEKCIYAPPPHTKLEEAPVYIPFITAIRALKEIATLQKGEWVLIHSATGAVGLAAIQYAKYVGAKIIATVGNEDKKEYLKGLGVHYCADSRSLSFAADVMRWTEGRGVDVVLNSLFGEALTKSWSLLAPYGRFIEIGKRDISMNSALPMRHFNNNTTFASIDLDRTFIDQPKMIGRLLKETHSLFEKQIFKALPCEIFPAKQVVEAFQFMARSKHMGKIMLKFENETVLGVPLEATKSVVDPSASYLVTGGFSGFGLSVAQWLVEKGARHLILVGRRGANTEEAKAVLESFKKEGVKIKIAAVDVTNLKQMTLLFDQSEKKMPPIKGVIHSAMVLDDGFMTHVTLESIQRVLSPKIAGCILLHQLTQNRSLDFFVLFSSISALIGNPGQGSYAAANSFLDSFCHYRQSLQLPALTINWGALSVGVLARNSQVAKHLESHGIKGIPKNSALKILENAIRQNQAQVCAMDVNWGTLMQRMPTIKQSLKYSEFMSHHSEEVSTLDLVDMNETERLNTVIGMIRETVAKTLRIDSEKLDITMRLNNMGMDSLMAMELQTTMDLTLGIKIPTMELMKGPSIKQLAQYFLATLR